MLSIRSFLVAATALSTVSVVHAADLIIDEPTIGVVEAADPSIYFQVLGGVVAGGELNYYLSGDRFYDYDAGWALTGTVGVVVADGLSIEGDVLVTRREYSDLDGDFVTSASFMANAKYRVALNDAFGIYAAVGAGYIVVDSLETGNHYGYAGLGYQAIVGADFALSDGISLVGEVRYQDSFDFLKSDTAITELGAPTVTALAGLKFSF